MWKEYICGSDCDSYLYSFFNSISDGFALHRLIYDANDNPIDYEFMEVNNTFTAITGLTRENIVGKKVSEAMPDFPLFWIDMYHKLSISNVPFDFDIYNEQSEKYYKISCFSPAKDQYAVLLSDITDLKKANEIMKKHQALFDNAQDIIFYANADNNVVDANKNAIIQYGYSLNELLKLNVRDLRHHTTHEVYEGQMMKADANGIVFECIHVRKDGTSFPVEVSAKSVLINGSRLRIHIVRDTSERKIAEEKIKYLANFDSLTGIANRSYLMDHLNVTIENAHRGNFKFALMLFDIDKFKNINDAYGHEIGDAVLREIAKIVQNAIRKVDFIARLGGDEFVIIQPYINDAGDSSTLAERILEQLKKPLRIDNKELYITISIGIAIYPYDSTDIEHLLRFSDKAMYNSKQISGNSYKFYSKID